MNPSSMTVLELWALLGKIFSGIVVFCGGYMTIAKLVSHFRSKTTVAKHTAQLKELRTFTDRDYEKIRALEERLDASSREMNDMHRVTRLTLDAVQELLKATMHGDNKEGVERVSSDIDDYMKSRI